MPDSSAQTDRIADIPRLWARSAPDSPALWKGGLVVTFRTLQHLIDRAAVLLLERGVVAGDRVAIVAENSVAEVAMFFAASRLGAWPVIVNARLSSREVETTCAHCQPRVEVFVTGTSVEAGQHASRRGGVEFSDRDLGRVAFTPTAVHAIAEEPRLDERVSTLIYTSGTTGAPKGVMVTHSGLLHFCGVSVAARRLNQADVVYAALPMSHIFGIATILLSTLYAGASCAAAGELWLRSATMMMGYYGDPDQSAAALRPGGWLATGDLVRVLEDGSMAIIGRCKEMIIRSGFNFYPAEVETALNAIAQVLQSGVVGRGTPDGNEEVVAFVQFRAGQQLSSQEIRHQLRSSLAAYKCPSRIVILDALPTGPTGKIWKARLAQMAAQP